MGYQILPPVKSRMCRLLRGSDATERLPTFRTFRRRCGSRKALERGRRLGTITYLIGMKLKFTKYALTWIITLLASVVVFGEDDDDVDADIRQQTCSSTNVVQPVTRMTMPTISYVLLAVSGTLEEGFELRSNMDYHPVDEDDGSSSQRVNATFLGKALVRGYKSFLDIKNPTWRYV